MTNTTNRFHVEIEVTTAGKLWTWQFSFDSKTTHTAKAHLRDELEKYIIKNPLAQLRVVKMWHVLAIESEVRLAKELYGQF